MSIKILTGDCRELLKTLPSHSVHTCVTSPPYWGLRNYGHPDQLGLEPTPEAYVENMVKVFREVKRILRDSGSLWINLGDSYVSAATGGLSSTPSKMTGGRSTQEEASKRPSKTGMPGLKTKDLVGIPWMVAFALRDDGWYLRQDIIWAKPNPMPESVTDRCTKSHEYIFLLSKSPTYYYDYEAIKEPSTMHPSDWNEDGTQKRDSKVRGDFVGKDNQVPGKEAFRTISATRNKRSVWTVTTKAYKGAHFATFPTDLIEPCIKAGSSEGGCCHCCGTPLERLVENGDPDLDHQKACGGDAKGEYHGTATKDFKKGGAQDASETKARILAGMVSKKTVGWKKMCSCNDGAPVPCTVLDPFAGAGTTGLVSDRLGRNAILCELNPEYIKLADTRISDDAPLFAHVETE